MSDAMIELSLVGRQLDEELAQVERVGESQPRQVRTLVSENRCDAVIFHDAGVIGTAMAPSWRRQIVRRRRHHTCGPRCIPDDHCAPPSIIVACRLVSVRRQRAPIRRSRARTRPGVRASPRMPSPD